MKQPNNKMQDMDSEITNIILILVSLCVMSLAAYFANQPQSAKEPEKNSTKKKVPDSLPVIHKQWFFSKAESQFYEQLLATLSYERFRVFPNVRLQDIFLIRAKGEDYHATYKRFQDKHVDFLIVSVPDYQPIIGIELDGETHEKVEQQYRDSVKNVVFESADLPLLRFRNEDHLTISELKNKLRDYLDA